MNAVTRRESGPAIVTPVAPPATPRPCGPPVGRHSLARRRRTHARARWTTRPALLAALLSLAGGLALATVAGTAPRLARFDPFNAGRYALHTYRDADGLPQNTVHAITLDRDGRLWIGTQDGAAFYNGRSWTTVTPPTRLQSNFIRTLLATRDGSMWLGTQAAGLCRLKEGSWTVISDALPDIRVNALAETIDAGGHPVLWVGTHNGGVARLTAGAWSTLGTAAGLPSDHVWALLGTSDAAGKAVLWAGTEGGLASLREGSRRFIAEPGVPAISVNSLLETTAADGTRTLWAGTYGGGAFYLQAGTWHRLSKVDGLPSDHVTSMAVSGGSGRDTVLWIGTDGGGVARVTAGAVEVLDITNGLSSNAVYSLLYTTPEEGTAGLWVGTRNGGLALLKEGQWRQFSPVADLPSLPVTCILEARGRDSEPSFWFGTDGGGLVQLHNGEWRIYDSTDGALHDDIVQCLLEVEEDRGPGSIWIGTRHGGVTRLSGGRSTTFDARSGALPNDMVQALFAGREEDGSTSVWVGTRSGLARYWRGRWDRFGRRDGLPSDSILCLAASGAGTRGTTFWIGTAEGLARRIDGRFESVDAGSALINRAVQCLLETPGTEGRPFLWIGTDGGGAARLDLAAEPRRWLTLTDETRPPLPNNTVYSIVSDLEGRLYMLTNRGVARLSRRVSPTAGEPELDVFTYTVHDGLPRNQSNRGAGLVDSRGRIWVGTVGGAAAFDPSRERVDRAVKRLHVDATFGGDTRKPLSPQQSLSHRDNSVAFAFSLLSFFREQDTRYRTQLLGLDAQPSAWTSEARKEYPTLPDGEYVFRIWGRDYAGNVSGPVDLPFEVRPTPWKTWWFGALVVGALAGAAYLAARVRMRAHHRRERALSTLVDARTRELQEANQILVDLSYLDPLTGVANRRRFEERLDGEWKRAVRGATLMSLIMIDIDWFKPFNDTYGHQRGDECLRAVARALADGLPRAGDSVARYGGEEFVVILPNTDRVGAVKVAEHLRRRVEALAIDAAASKAGRAVTISCGVATIRPGQDREPGELIHLADAALYRAKQAGRNLTRAEEAEQLSSASLGAS